MTDTLSIPMPAAPEDPDDLATIVRSKGVLVSLEITTWSGRRLDKRVTRDTNAREGAGEDAGRFNKNLLGGRVDSFAACIASAGASRVAHYRQTLPWADGDVRLLVITNYFEYTKMIREARVEHKRNVDRFLLEYPAIVADAAAKLGAMYNPDDYPSVEIVKNHFQFKIHFSPVPAASDIRLDLPPEVVSHMERSITARVETAVHSAVREGWTRLYESVERIRDRVREIATADPNGPAGRLHASLFAGAIETAETLKRLNILEDPELARTADRIIAEFRQLDPKAIRKDPDSMQATADRAEEILAAMAGVFGNGGVS